MSGRRTGPATVVLLALLAALAVAAAPAVATPSQTDETDRAQHLTLVAQTPWVVPGGTLAVRVRIDDAPRDAVLRARLHDRVRSRSEFARALEGRGLRTVRGERRVELAGAARDADGAVAVRLPTGTLLGEDPVATLTQAGVYPVVVDLLVDGEPADRFVTMLVRLAAADPAREPIGAAIVVPLHAAPAHVAPGELDVEALARLHVTLDALHAHAEVPAVVAATPESVAAAREADPTAAPRFVEALAGRQVLAGPWVRIDVGAWDAAGLDEELDRQYDAGEAALRSASGSGPAPDRGVALVPSGGGVRAVRTLAGRGARAVVVADDELTPLDGDDFPVTLARPFRVPAEGGDDPATVAGLAADSALAAHAGSTGDAVLDAHHLLADLAVLANDAPVSRRGVVVALDDEAAADPAFLDALLGGLGRAVGADAAPAVEAVTVADILEEVEPAGAGGGVDEDDPLVRDFAGEAADRRLGALADDLAAARAEAASSRTVFGDDALAADVDELLLTAGAASLEPGERRRLLASGLDALRARLGGIHGPPRQRVTLTDREGQIQLVLGNDTGQPVRVVLELRGDRLEFPDHPDGRVDLQLADPTTRVDLDLRARSSGDAPLDLRLTSPDGRLELGRSRVTVRTTAVSGVGVVLLVTAALFLVVWWTRTILRERGSRRRPRHAR